MGFEHPFEYFLAMLRIAQGAHGVTPQNPRKKLVATASRREGVYNRTGEPSVTFYPKGHVCERGEAREWADDFFA